MALAISGVLAHKQLITNNLSSKVIVQLLNSLINAAVEPLFKHSSLARELVLQALLQTQSDHRRKISIHEKPITAACIIYGVAQNNYDTIRLCELDRNILFKTILFLEPHLLAAIQLERKLIKKPESKRLHIKQRQLSRLTGIAPHLLTPLARWCLPYLHLYLQFKERIAAKYFKYSYQEAARAQFNTKLFVDSQDLFKNYLLALDRAIDKFDANRGTLTSYIAKWMMSAKSAPEFDHQYNVAYHLPANVRKAMERSGTALTNMSTPITEAHHEIEDEEIRSRMNEITSGDKLFVQCLRYIKGVKIPYLLLDIPIVLSEIEISNLQGLLPINTAKKPAENPSKVVAS